MPIGTFPPADLPADDPVAGKALPCPRPSVFWDGDQVPVAPDGIPVVGVGVDWAFKTSGPVGHSAFGIFQPHIGSTALQEKASYRQKSDLGLGKEKQDGEEEWALKSHKDFEELRTCDTFNSERE